MLAQRRERHASGIFSVVIVEFVATCFYAFEFDVHAQRKNFHMKRSTFVAILKIAAIIFLNLFIVFFCLIYH